MQSWYYLYMEYEKLIKAISQKTGLALSDTQNTLEAMLKVINDELEAGRSINIPNFGNFEVVAGANIEENIAVIEEEIKPVRNLDIKKIRIPKKILSLIPQHIARQYNIAPVALDNELLTVIMLETDSETIEFISKRTGLKINSLACDIYELEHALDQYNNIQ
jgi:nucleoid DNA-binding protein